MIVSSLVRRAFTAVVLSFLLVATGHAQHTIWDYAGTSAYDAIESLRLMDGLIDIYFPNGAPLPGGETDTSPGHALYRNLGDWRFQDVTEQAGLTCSAYGMGITIGDHDNDGFPDIYLNNFGANIFFHNKLVRSK